MDLTVGWQFDLALVAIGLIGYGVYRLVMRLTTRDQHLADAPVVRVPIRTRDDWDWPGR